MHIREPRAPSPQGGHSPSFTSPHPPHTWHSALSIAGSHTELALWANTDLALTSWGWEIKYQKVGPWWEISIHSIALQSTWWYGHVQSLYSFTSFPSFYLLFLFDTHHTSPGSAAASVLLGESVRPSLSVYSWPRWARAQYRSQRERARMRDAHLAMWTRCSHGSSEWRTSSWRREGKAVLHCPRPQELHLWPDARLQGCQPPARSS